MEENKKKSVVVKTFAEDMAEVLKEDHEGLVKRVIHGAEEKEEIRKSLSPDSGENKIFLILSAVLFLAGAGLIIFFWVSRGPKTVPVEEQFTPIVFNDRMSYVEIGGFKKDEIEQIIFNATEKSGVKDKGVEGVYPLINSKMIGLRSFLGLLKSSLVLPKEEELVSDRFMVGLVNVGPDEAQKKSRPGFFLLIKMRSAPDIFENLRAWEPKMFLDLHGFFGYTLSSDTNYLLNKEFEDGLIENKNARILRSQEGEVVLMYIFADDTSVIITNSEAAAKEMILRLSSRENKQ